MWVKEIVQASALFMVESSTPKRNLALLVQESIRDPRKDFKQEDLETLSPRSITKKNKGTGSDDDEMIEMTEEEIKQLVKRTNSLRGKNEILIFDFFRTQLIVFTVFGKLLKQKQSLKERKKIVLYFKLGGVINIIEIIIFPYQILYF